jgi:hypothetical protein
LSTPRLNRIQTQKSKQEIPNISSENRVRSIRTFPNEKKNIFVKKQRILINFHIISAYNSEISSELSEYSEWARKKFRNCPNTPNWPRKKIRNCPNTPNDLGKKFGIIRILRMTSEKLPPLFGKYRQIRKLFQASSEKISALALPLLVQFLSFIRKKIPNFIRKKFPNYIWKKFPNYIC